MSDPNANGIKVSTNRVVNTVAGIVAAAAIGQMFLTLMTVRENQITIRHMQKSIERLDVTLDRQIQNAQDMATQISRMTVILDHIANRSGMGDEERR